MTQPYVLTRGAAADIRDISRYTRERWGTTQCRTYINQLESAASEVACGQGQFKTRNDILPGLRIRKAEHHYIFCLPRPNQPALILAILHERMDMLVRLRKRLEE